MKRKLEEMSTIFNVHVDVEEYPSSGSGGWGGTAVEDGTAGGYVWKVGRKRRLCSLHWRAAELGVLFLSFPNGVSRHRC